MASLETLQRAISSTHDLQMVVRTMKALAAASIRQYEHAVVALAEYARTTELGLQILVRSQPEIFALPSAPPDDAPAAVVFGTDHGMVGQFNERVAAHAAEALPALAGRAAGCRSVAVGERVAARLEDEGLAVERTFGVPGSVAGITALVQDVLVHIDSWRGRRIGGRLVLVYNQARGGALYQPVHLDLLPVDQRWLRELAARPWPSRRLPTFTQGWEELFAALLRQHLFVALYRACAESLASESASRLAAMQRAERHIDERLDELTRAYHQQRHDVITAELLDIVAGVEALADLAPRRPDPPPP